MEFESRGLEYRAAIDALSAAPFGPLDPFPIPISLPASEWRELARDAGTASYTARVATTYQPPILSPKDPKPQVIVAQFDSGDNAAAL